MFLALGNFTVSSLKCLEKGLKTRFLRKFSNAAGTLQPNLRPPVIVVACSRPCGPRPIYNPPEFLAESTPVASLSIMELNLVSKPFKAFFIGFNALSLISKPLFLRLQSLNRGDERQILCTTDISFWFVSLDIL